MDIIREILQGIASQHAQHRHRNLFYNGDGHTLTFTPYTRNLLRHRQFALLQLDEAGKGPEIAHYLALQAEQVFYDANQYINMGTAHKAALEAVYLSLWQDILSMLRLGQPGIDELEGRHSQRLAQWLLDTNPFLQEINSSSQPLVKQVVCAEYPAELQLQVLSLDMATLKEPVLDLGCGPHAPLVHYLRQHGIDVLGIDRHIEQPQPWLRTADWFEFELQLGHWGTVLSNLSFSNHFIHHHTRKEGQYLQYARRYMEILQSLQPGGSYHYAPHLPMMEAYLPEGEYRVENNKVNEQFMNAVVTRTVH